MKNTVLIVDDDDDIREILADLFDVAQIKTIVFSNLTEAKAWLSDPNNSATVHSIISDLMMGQDSGLEFLSYVKSNKQLNAIDFFLLTGASHQTFDEYINQNGLKGVIEKPFDTNKLIEMFSAVNQSKQSKAA